MFAQTQLTANDITINWWYCYTFYSLAWPDPYILLLQGVSACSVNATGTYTASNNAL